VKPLPLRVLYAGTEEPLRETRELRSGQLTALYEDGGLRYVRWGSREILRRIYVAVRDRNWGTVPAVLSDLRIDSSLESFEITFNAECKRNEIHFTWKGSIRGDPKGTIVFSMDGEAKSTFMKNRIGICILHPIKECAGRPCVIERVSGAVNRGSFPRYVWAQQPFQDLRALSHEVAPGVRARVAFEGDTFEMEDQRNWADASYKIYSTPLRLPYPVELKKGAKVAQSVTLTVEGATPTSRIIPSSIAVSVGTSPVSDLPRLGLCMASHGRPLSPFEVGRLKAMRLAHIRADLKPSSPDCDDVLQRATNDARQLGVPLEVALHLTDKAEDEINALIPKLVRADTPLTTWLIFHQSEKSTTKRWVTLAREKLIPFHPDVRLGAGTDAYFVEINRGHPPKDIELLCYSINPQVHASDNLTIIENIEGMEATVESARLVGEDHPMAIGPITLRPRFNPDATGPEQETGPGDLPARVDPRQMSLFGAGWTVGTLKALAKPGVHSITYYETTGRLGVMEREKDPPLHRRFPSMAGWAFPLYHALADAGEFAGAGVLPWTSANNLVIEGIGLTKKGGTRILLANLTEQPQKVRLACPLFKGEVRVKRLDETNVMEAMSNPEAFRADMGQVASGQPLEIDLLPYAVCRVDG
jgi:D-apionolactonase